MAEHGQCLLKMVGQYLEGHAVVQKIAQQAEYIVITPVFPCSFGNCIIRGSEQGGLQLLVVQELCTTCDVDLVVVSHLSKDLPVNSLLVHIWS